MMAPRHPDPERPVPETLQLLTYEYAEDVLERREPYRAEHLAAIARWKADGRLVIAGAVGVPPHAAVLAFRGEPQVAEEFTKDDPYVAAGIVTAWKVEPWTVVTPLD